MPTRYRYFTSSPALRGTVRPLAERLFVRGANLLPVLALTLTELNSAGPLGFIASPVTKTAASLLAAIAAFTLLSRGEARPPAPRVVALVTALVVFVSIVSLVNDVPNQRYLLLAQHVVVAFTMLTWFAVRPDRVIGILFTTGLVHCVLAKAVNTEVPWMNGLQRLGGGSHPIQLGFEASFVLICSLVAIANTTRFRLRGVYLLVVLYSAYVLYEAFARESLIAASIALVVLAFVVPGPFRGVRAFFAICGTILLFISLGPDGIASLLGENRASDLSGASGRTEIWARILTYLPEFFLLGYGYYSLNDGVGPDRVVYFASKGAPAENAPLQVLLDGGIVYGVIWAAYIAVAIVLIARSRGASRQLALAVIPIFIVNALVSSSLSGVGIEWWYFFAVVAESAVSRMGAAPIDPVDQESLRRIRSVKVPSSTFRAT